MSDEPDDETWPRELGFLLERHPRAMARGELAAQLGGAAEHAAASDPTPACAADRYIAASRNLCD